MAKKKYKYIIPVLLINLAYFVFFIFLSAPANALSLTNPTDNLQVKIPNIVFSNAGTCSDDPTKLCINWIGEYISAVYKYAIGIVGILATVVMMFGGFRWLTAGGNPSAIGEAQEWIKGSLTGLVIALSSFVILYQINPDLITIKPVRLTQVTAVAAVTAAAGAQCSMMSDTDCSKNMGATSDDNSKCSSDSGSATAGTAEPTGEICCCAKCNNNIACNFCQNCVAAGPGYLNQGFYNQLQTVSGSWKITEAWPPTINHISSCHKDGTCADIGVMGNTTVSNIQTLFNNFTASGFSSLQYETTDCTSYANITGMKCDQNPKLTGPHFHVNADNVSGNDTGEDDTGESY